jgi:Sulfatase-modifying factor enzyme 1
MPHVARALALVVPVALCACSGHNAASELAKAPAFEPEGQTKCSVRKSPDKPLIVEWPSADRVALEARARRGAVPVRYDGCEMEVLTRCTAPGEYAYAATSKQRDRVHIVDEDELYANLPIGAAKLEGALARAGELNVDMTIVGRYELDPPEVSASQLTGDCSRATHVIVGMTAGAFEFFAGAEATVGAGVMVAGVGAGAKSGAKRETLNQAGDASACDAAKRVDSLPPEGCGALLRVEVAPLSAAVPVSSTPSTPVGAPVAVAPVAVAPVSAGAASPPTGLVRLDGGSFTTLHGKKAKVSRFEIDTTEVTVAAYDACVQAGKCPPRNEHPSRARFNDSCNGSPVKRRKGSASHPMNCVLREEAASYCRFANKRLPTSSEWEYAARGGGKTRKYPWGNDPPNESLLNGRGSERGKSRRLYRHDDGFVTTAPVGSFPPTDIGLYDMGGNVSEWVNDGDGVVRYWGGNFGISYPDEIIQSWSVRSGKGGTTLSQPGSHVGFRCVRTAK